ncbi:hypothetical protein LQV63_28880 [Paenibacillus profundus]|uniref:Fibronectin type-III domain-containing protein n=1 Tax=Paenibacillus profundus TaxID=1173085 RepID=A0ABS8YRN1_9BACL|nr:MULTISPECIES: hypothetical protein [Paenibacillus]MCE5173275.1 hypothetical protein [Paenibacillus profundus]MCM3340605.1 hypothetical protein [Paenibacillus sp. MER TA 81-3]
MKKMFATVLTTALLLTSAVPAFAQESTQASAPTAASVVNSESISAQSYFFANISWRNVSGASHYEFFVYKNGNLHEWGSQSSTNRDVGMETGSAYRVEIRAVGPNGNQLAWGATNTFLAGPTSIYVSL